MGRSLTNAMVNLGVDSEMEEALYEVNRLTSTLKPLVKYSLAVTF